MTRGLGSSSACIAAGLIAANRFLGSPLSQHDLVNLACKIEGHPDNTTPALLGGLVTSAMENGRVYSVSVPVAKNIRFGVFIPPFELKTEVARNALPNEYTRENAVYNLSRSSLMTAALFSGSLENLRVAVQDSIHQPYRKKFISGVDTVFRMTYELGSYGTYISGAGPSIIAIIDNTLEDTFNKYALPHLESRGINDWQFHVLTADDEGAKVLIE